MVSDGFKVPKWMILAALRQQGRFEGATVACRPNKQATPATPFPTILSLLFALGNPSNAYSSNAKYSSSQTLRIGLNLHEWVSLPYWYLKPRFLDWLTKSC